MDKFSITGDELRQHYGKEARLKQVFRDIELDLQASHQVVCRFVVNGIELNEHEEIKYAQAGLQEVATLEFWVEQPYNLVVGVTEGWLGAMPELIENTEQLVAYMRNPTALQNIKPFYDLVENCEFLVGSLISLCEMGGNHFDEYHGAWQETSEKLKALLIEGYNFVEKKDYVGLADVLEYELIPCFELWQSTLKQVESKLKENQDELKQKLQYEDKQGAGQLAWKLRPH